MNQDPFELAGKRALVTGAGRNVGRAIAELFARSGMSVGLVDLDEQRGQESLAAVSPLNPGHVMFLKANVAKKDDVEHCVDQFTLEFGGVDVLVNCVAITDRPSDIINLPLEKWQQVLDVSLTSVFLCTQAVSKQMIKQGTGGSIVTIGSTSGHRGRANAVAYGPAKAAVTNMTMNSATQLGQYGIRVNTVTPNMVGSPVGEDEEAIVRKRQNLLGRSCAPEDVANAVGFMASDKAAFITASELLVDGGSLYGGK
jgi:3-oxoacyl-[acyl-carrier protein] reductase